ncbi:hypothetical protein CBS101457_004662 [Exobasidium rhododendri]|nr:hypothetical protein CBS101457_004662 [Exobasidium rhododendri]
MSSHSSASVEKTDQKMDHSRTDHHTSDVDEKNEMQLRQDDDEGSALSQVTLHSLLLALGICIGGFLFGYDIGVISGCLIMEPFERTFGQFDTETMTYILSPDTSSLITATLSIGTFVGALAQAPISDFMGRKRSMLVWAVFFTIGAIIQTASGELSTVSANRSQIYAGRFFAGLGVGALSGLSPLYLAETAPKAIRGAMVSCYQLLIIFGIFLSYAISYGSAQITTSSACWRIPVGLQCAWGILLIGIMIVLPESPRWLLQRNREVDAREVMCKMRGVPLVDDGAGLRGDKAMEADLAEMVEGLREESKAFAGYNYFTAYALCFSSKNQMWRRTLTGMMLQLLQQLCGQNFYYYYGPTFFKAAGTDLDPLAIQLILGAVSLICTVPALISIEKIGRRRSLIFGAFAQATCAYIVAFVGHYAINQDPTHTVSTPSQKMAANAFIAFAVIHLAFYSALWGPTPWIFCSENFPQHLRAKSISLCSATNWIWNFLLSFFSAKIAAQYGSFIMLIFASVMCFAGVFVFLVVPELKGLSLEQVDEMYENRSLKPWQTSKWVPQSGRDTNRSAIGISHIVKFNKDRRR